MAHEPASQDREPSRSERGRTPPVRVFEPPLPVRADARLRSWLADDYGVYDEPSLHDATPMLLPATLVTPLGVRVEESASRPPALVNGPSGTYTRAEGPCPPGILARLAPLGAYTLLGPAVSEIGGAIVGLDEIVGADARRLGERIESARTWEVRGHLLDDFLLGRAADGPRPSPEVTHALYLLARSGGTDRIRQIARQVGWSHKHLISRFKQQIGVAPHLAARLLRLSAVWRHIDGDQSWARVAAECGYADQAHLTREFRRFTGTTPGALVTT